jgi:hypothetical protein
VINAIKVAARGWCFAALSMPILAEVIEPKPLSSLNIKPGIPRTIEIALAR